MLASATRTDACFGHVVRRLALGYRIGRHPHRDRHACVASLAVCRVTLNPLPATSDRGDESDFTKDIRDAMAEEQIAAAETRRVVFSVWIDL